MYVTQDPIFRQGSVPDLKSAKVCSSQPVPVHSPAKSSTVPAVSGHLHARFSLAGFALRTQKRRTAMLQLQTTWMLSVSQAPNV